MRLAGGEDIVYYFPDEVGSDIRKAAWYQYHTKIY